MTPSSPEAKSKPLVTTALMRIIFLSILLGHTWILYGFFIRTPFHLYFDELGYFMETKGSDSLWDGLKLVDYAKARTYWKGDDVLFRPLLFVWLAIQNSLFFYHYQMWNWLQFGVFLGLMWIFFEILLKTGPPVFAGLWILFFVSSPTANGLLRNVHLGGYLLGTVFFLWAFRALYFDWIKDQSLSRKAVLLWIGCMSVAGFFYEIYIFFTLCFAFSFLFLLRSEKWKTFFLLGLPVVLYGVIYLLRMPEVHQMTYMESVPQNSFFDPQALTSSGSNTIWTFRHLSGNILHTRGWPRLMVTLFFLSLMSPAFSRSWISKIMPFLISLFTSVLIYCALIGWMRGGFYREYYDFVFAVLSLMFVFLLFDWNQAQGFRKRLACLLMIILIAWNSFGVRKRLHDFVAYEKSFHLYFESLTSFIDQHRKEPDFSFVIDRPDTEVDHGHEMRVGYADTPEPYPIKRTSEIMYAKFYREQDPKYHLSWNQDHWQVRDSQMMEIR